MNALRDLRVHLLDARVDEIDEGWARTLVGYSEGPLLDVKSAMYGNGDSDKRELAADIAALANVDGGVILVGATEVDGVVDDLVPIEITDQEPRVRAILANNVVPVLGGVDVVWIDATGKSGFGYLAIRVQPSTHRPHAVEKGKDLRFPVRDGSTKRYMRIDEIEREIVSRQQTEKDRSERSVVGLTNVQRHRDLEDGGAWLIASFVPARPGFMAITRQNLTEINAWMPKMEDQLPGLPAWRSATVGPGQFVCGDFQTWRDGVEGYFGVRSIAAQFHTDGSASIMTRVDRQKAEDDAPPGRLKIYDEALAVHSLNQLALAGEHLVRTGAGGQVAVAAQLVSDETEMTIGHDRQHWWMPLHGSRPMRPMDAVRFSCAATELTTPKNLLGWASTFADLLVNCFGVPHLPQFEGGVINDNMFNSANHGWSYGGQIARWKSLNFPTDRES